MDKIINYINCSTLPAKNIIKEKKLLKSDSSKEIALCLTCDLKECTGSDECIQKQMQRRTKQKRWTKNEVEWLKNNHGTLTVEEMAKALSRNVSSVQHKLISLGLSNRHLGCEWKGCDLDCFNCGYKDCIIPEKELIKKIEMENKDESST